MRELSQGLALAGALGFGAVGCDGTYEGDSSNANTTQHQQRLSVPDLANLQDRGPLPWSNEGDGNANICHLDGQNLIVFLRSGLGLSYVKCNEMAGCTEAGVQVEQILGLPRGIYYSGFIYTNNQRESKLIVDMANGEFSMSEFNIRFNANNQLEVFGAPGLVSPNLPGVYPSYFESNGVPSVFWSNDVGGTIRNLITGVDTPVDPSGNGTLDRYSAECGSPGIDSSSGMVVVGTVIRDAQGQVCRFFQGDSVLDPQRSRLNRINDAHPNDGIGTPRSADNVLIYQSAPRDGSSYAILNYAIAQPALPLDAGTPDAVVDAAPIVSLDAAALDAAMAADAAALPADQGLAIADLGLPLDQGTGGAGGNQVPDQGTGGAGGNQLPDLGTGGAGGSGGIQSSDLGMGGTGGVPTPDGGAGGMLTPDTGTGGTQSLDASTPTPDAGPTPDAFTPAELSPFHITLETGNCVKEAATTVPVGRVNFTQVKIAGDGSETCELQIDSDNGKAPAHLTISNDRHGRMNVTILLSFDPNGKIQVEATTANTTLEVDEDPNGLHLNFLENGVVTASAASHFRITTREATQEGHQIFEVASFNKPEEPQVFVVFEDGSSLFVESNGKTYIVDIDTGAITEKLPELPTCEAGDPSCSVETGGSGGEGGAGGSNVPGETGSNKSGCDCSIGGQEVSPEAYLVLLGLVAARFPRKKKRA